jgi:hypothetical protein
MCHVVPGSLAKSERRKSAMERMSKHLSNHPENHKMSPEDQKLDNWKSHDKIQRSELEHLKELCK